MMKYGNRTIQFTVFSLSTLLLNLIFLANQTTTAQTIGNQFQKPEKKSARNLSVGKNSAAAKQNEIPDKVAYELFLRTLAEDNARGLLEKGKFTEQETDRIMSDANLLDMRLAGLLKRARETKENQNNLSKAQADKELSSLQEKKNEYITETLDHFLPNGLREDGMNKLKDFIDTQVKSNIQAVAANNTTKRSRILPGKTPDTSPPRYSAGGQLYFYSAAWHDDLNVYGSGTLSEQYASSTSYQVTVTVTSSSGRSNTTTGDWSYATVTNTTGLSIGDDDGIFNVQADFQQQDGYYNSYGNFNGNGSLPVGNATNSTMVAPFVALRQVGFPPLGINTMSAGETLNISAKIFATANVPVNTPITLELNETDVPTVQYSVIDVEDAAHSDPTPRSVHRLIGNPGTILETTIFRVRVPANETRTGKIFNQIRIDDAGVSVATPNSINFVVNVSSTTSGGGNECDPVCYDGGGGAYRVQKEGSTGVTRDNLDIGPGDCCRYSPILVDILGDGFAMTDEAGGVDFDFNGDGIRHRMSWTAANADDAWLVLDRNQNNLIDSSKEMFGNFTEQPASDERNGFLALAESDKAANGGNGDGEITRSDAVFTKLRLWQDRNHNGTAEIEELSRLPALDVVALDLKYKASKRTDEFGNQFRYRAKARDSRNARVGRWAWDVFLTLKP